jgi:hypothetical protein
VDSVSRAKALIGNITESLRIEKMNPLVRQHPNDPNEEENTDRPGNGIAGNLLMSEHV